MSWVVVLLLFVIPVREQVKIPFLDKLKKKTPIATTCTTQYATRLASLFQLMCNNLQSETEETKNACVGCFQQATRSYSNQPSLNGLNACASTYLPASEYDDCLNLINVATPTPAPGGCVTGYCSFVQCIRRRNADMLISDCYGEASVDNDAVLDFERVMLFKNITSCVLARARCANVNPITGEPQTSEIVSTTTDKWGKPTRQVIPLYNTLQITPDGDLRIVQFPGTTKIVNYFCANRANLRESSWLEYSC